MRTRLTPPAPRLELLEAREVPATLLVDDDFAADSGNKFRTIQAAVDAANPGDTIRVNPGKYVEQVTVPDDKDRLRIEARQERRAVIVAPAKLTGTNAVVRVAGAERVTLDGFTITGPMADWGVHVDKGGSATIRDNLITGIGTGLADDAPTGGAVLIGGRSADGKTPATATVDDNTIVDYHRGGIVVVNEGTEATITDNTVTGSGPNKFVAQNGIQVAFGAAAVIDDNRVSRNVYTGSDFEAAGIFVFDAGSVVVTDNRLSRNQDGILVEDTDGIVIARNRIDGSVLDGIVLAGEEGVTGAFVFDNRIDDSGRDGIVVEDSDSNFVILNRVDDSGRFGIAVTGDSSKNVIAFNRVDDSGKANKHDSSTGPNTWFANDFDDRKGKGHHDDDDDDHGDGDDDGDDD
jgi:parallel beta-helix repeat protein